MIPLRWVSQECSGLSQHNVSNRQLHIAAFHPTNAAKQQKKFLLNLVTEHKTNLFFHSFGLDKSKISFSV